VGQQRIKAFGEFARFLNGNWQREVILIETLRIFEEVIGCIRASGYLVENGDFELKAKLGEPIVLNSLDILNSVDKYVSIFNSEDNYCEAMPLNESGLYITPLISGKDSVGLILFEIAEMSQNQKEMAAMVATMASMALINAGQAQERAKIDDVISTFGSGLNLELSYKLFAQKLKQLVPFDRFSIIIPDQFQSDQLLVYGNAETALQTKNVPYVGSGSALVINTGDTIVEDDLAENRSFIEDEMLLESGIRSALRAPLTSKGKTFGTLNLGSRLPHVFFRREVNLVTEIASKIGPAVENALVYDEVNKKLSQALIRLENNYSTTLNALAMMLDKRDTGTMGHSFRVIRYATEIAKRMGVTSIDLENIRLGSLLHDIGKLAVPDAVLFKAGRLNERELAVMRTHPTIGAEMVSKIEFLSPALPVVLYHHEWYNGNGYPKGLKREEIPLGARIFAIADTFDAITSNRPYRAGLPLERAVEELANCRSSQFCPECVDAFNRISETELINIFNECQKEITFSSPEMVGQDVKWAVAQSLANVK